MVEIAYWDCMDMNKPSIAIAEKIGFRNMFHYTGYELAILSLRTVKSSPFIYVFFN
ncbi:GNAT family N-acetyltransferase [Lysinibacillus fusiformis]|uniref:GNAT family N-acetyltransferase n=1 Tax=Lysinibacillus fusiformis TaxID=28031 RepID=UPI003CEC008B